jgi:hypothetical protein
MLTGRSGGTDSQHDDEAADQQHRYRSFQLHGCFLAGEEEIQYVAKIVQDPRNGLYILIREYPSVALPMPGAPGVLRREVTVLEERSLRPSAMGLVTDENGSEEDDDDSESHDGDSGSDDDDSRSDAESTYQSSEDHEEEAES